jgi:hypothetical protein
MPFQPHPAHPATRCAARCQPWPCHRSRFDLGVLIPVVIEGCSLRRVNARTLRVWRLGHRQHEAPRSEDGLRWHGQVKVRAFQGISVLPRREYCAQSRENAAGPCKVRDNAVRTPPLPSGNQTRRQMPPMGVPPSRVEQTARMTNNHRLRHGNRACNPEPGTDSLPWPPGIEVKDGIPVIETSRASGIHTLCNAPLLL